MLSPLALAGTNGYRQPPEDVVAILSTPKPPLILVAPNRAQAVLAEPEVFTRLGDLARPVVSVNGHRLDAGSRARRGIVHYSGMTLLHLETGESRRLAFDHEVRMGYPRWSPRSDSLAFAVFDQAGVELWHAGTDGARPVKLNEAILNTAGGRSFVWMPDGKRLLCRLVPGSARGMPSPPLPIPGPTVKEAMGAWHSTDKGPSGRDASEPAWFDYFMRSQLALVDTTTGELSPIGDPDLYGEVAPSPDGRFIIVTRLAPAADARTARVSSGDAFEVWTSAGEIVSSLSPPSDGESTEIHKRRGFRWQPTASATLQWIEDVFPGEGLREPIKGERVMISPAPFTDAPREIFRSEHHITGVEWLDATDRAIVQVYDEDKRRTSAWLVDARQSDVVPRRLWTRHIDDRYGDPGQPIRKPNAVGLDVVAHDRGHIYMNGSGTTPAGERPFVSRWSLAETRGEVIWRAGEGRYAEAVALLDTEPLRLLIRHESSNTPPNFAIVKMGDGERRELTHFRYPGAEAFRVRKEIVTFRRADGILLQATLYLPVERAPNERLPLVLWAYPRKYADAERAGQVSRSGNRFSAFDRAIPAFLAMRGFAVMDQVSMPIVGAGDGADQTFSDQVVASAKAAIDKAVELGIADPDRVGVAGHSYGAFMTVSLLAHSRLFRAGVALSGAYNRTLTPFGFQTERRTLWEAPGLYIEMSPLMYANRIKAPLLLIHGSRDENFGTLPMQSERLFQAIKGQGGTARLVMLPYEGHVYRARESVLHSAAEMLEWFSLHLGRDSRMAHSVRMPASG